MVGIMKAWLGLLAARPVKYLLGNFAGNTGSGPKTLLFLLFSAGFVFLCSVAVSPFMLENSKIAPRHARAPPMQYVAFLLGLLAIMCALIAASVFSAYAGGTLHVVLSSLLALSYVMPLATCFGRGGYQEQPASDRGADASLSKPLVTIAVDENVDETVPFASVWATPDAPSVDLPLYLHLTQRLRYVFINNGSLMCDSANVDINATLGGIISIMQAVGRLVVGIASDYCMKRGTPRPVFLLAISASAALAHVLLMVGQSEIFFMMSAALAGASFGALWPMMVLLIRDFWGADHHSTNYSFYNGVSAAAGTLLFAKFLPQSIYDSHTVSGKDCMGSDCFFISHLVCAAACAVAFVSSAWLIWKTKNVKAYKYCWPDSTSNTRGE